MYNYNTRLSFPIKVSLNSIKMFSRSYGYKLCTPFLAHLLLQGELLLPLGVRRPSVCPSVVSFLHFNLLL